MSELLFREAFQKAEEEFRTQVKNALAEALAEWCEEHAGYRVNARTLVRYYDKYLLRNQLPQEPKKELLDAMSRYLGYQHYEDYLKSATSTAVSMPELTEDKPRRPKERAVVIALIAIIGVLLGYTFLGSDTKDSCMCWDTDRYVEGSCDITEAQCKTPIPLDPVLLAKQRRIQPQCDHPFFEEDHPKVFYGKGRNGDYEFFTWRGQHPVSGKELKPITPYMIRKYICPDWRKGN